MTDLFDTPRIAPKSPKMLNLREIGVNHAMEFNQMWHSRLPVTSHSNMVRNAHKVFYGAEFDGHCFASAMWTDPVGGNRMSKDHVWLELRIEPYPKGNSQKYDSGSTVETQGLLFG